MAKKKLKTKTKKTLKTGKRWSESALLLHSLSLGSILAFFGLFLSTLRSDAGWLDNNAINITFILVGASFILMSKVFKDRGRYLLKQFSDGINSSGDISSIVFIILGGLSFFIGILNILGIITTFSIGVVSVSSLIISIVLLVIWISSLKLEFK